MGSNNIDRNIRESLSDHEVHVNKDQLWSGIQERKKKNRFLFFMYFTTGLLLLSSLYFYTKYAQDNDKEVTEFTQSLTQPSNIKDKHGELQRSELKYKNETLAEAKKDETINNRSAAVADENQKRTRYNQTILEQKPILKNKLLFQRNETLLFPLRKNHAFKQRHIPLRTDMNDLKANTEILNSKTSLESTSPPSLKQSLLINEEFNAIDAIPILKMVPFDQQFILPDAELKTYDVLTFNKLEKTVKVKEYLLGINAGYSFIHKTFGDAESEESLSSIRNSIEEPLENISLGIDYTFKFQNGLYLKSGFTWNLLSEKVTYLENISDLKLEGGHIILEITNPDLTMEFQTGETMVQYDTVRNYVVYNTYTRTDFSLGIGYEKAFGKFLINGDINVALNLAQTFDGYILGEDYRMHQNPDVFKKRIGFQSYLSLGAGYQIRPNTSIWLRPNFHLNKWKVNNDENPTDQFYQLYGVNLSCRFKF